MVHRIVNPPTILEMHKVGVRRNLIFSVTFSSLTRSKSQMHLDPDALAVLRDACLGLGIEVRVTPRHLLDILPNQAVPY